MRPVGTSSPRPYGEVEEALRTLVTEVGGFAEAAQIIKKSPSTISSYLDAQSSTSITVRDLISLENASETKPTIHFLARLFRYELFKPSPPNDYNKWMEHISVITMEFGELLQAAHKCLADDGDIDPFESRQILKELDEHLSALCSMRGDLIKCSSHEGLSDLNSPNAASSHQPRDTQQR